VTPLETDTEAKREVLNKAANAEAPPWLEASLGDIQDLDFERPIAECNSAECRHLGTCYREAADLHEKLGDEASAPAARIFSMLSAITEFHFKPEDRNAPYGAMVEMEGMRSAMPEDFRGSPVEIIAHAAERATNRVLRARLSDVCWLLERHRHPLGRAAVESYVAVIEGLQSGLLKDRYEKDDPVLGVTARDILKRALHIGRAVGWENEEVIAAQNWVSTLRARAIAAGEANPVHWFSGLDLDYRISAPEELASELEQFVTGLGADSDSHTNIDLLRLAARAHRSANDNDGEFRCRKAAAEAFVDEAERALENQNSAMLASNWLSSAIAEYHGIPGERERRTELRHRLIDVQSGTIEEMQSFTQPIDLSECVEHVENLLDGDVLVDQLFQFAKLAQSPAPDKLRKDALKSIRDHPLFSLFGASYVDHDGKVIHRTDGTGSGNGENYGAIAARIAQNEQLRRQMYAFGLIETARQFIVGQYYFGEDTFLTLCRHSPFVPNHLVGTFSRGFVQFFRCDTTSALYILTPLLENSLRHVLKLNGHDVTTFDDSTQVQQDRSISALFEQMRQELDDVFGQAITTDIENVFLSGPGPSIRHAVAHGLLHDGSPFEADAIYACWLIFRLCCIPLFGHRESISLPT